MKRWAGDKLAGQPRSWGRNAWHSFHCYTTHFIMWTGVEQWERLHGAPPLPPLDFWSSIVEVHVVVSFAQALSSIAKSRRRSIYLPNNNGCWLAEKWFISPNSSCDIKWTPLKSVTVKTGKTGQFSECSLILKRPLYCHIQCFNALNLLQPELGF